jgi:anti-anti-sigma factor
MDVGDFSIDRDDDPGAPRLRVSGELDFATAPRLEDAAGALVEADAKRLVLDLSDLRFIDSSGLRAVIVLHERSEREGWSLDVVRPPGQLLRVFQISGIDEHLNFIEPDGAGEPAQST